MPFWRIKTRNTWMQWLWQRPAIKLPMRRLVNRRYKPLAPMRGGAVAPPYMPGAVYT